MKSKRATYRKKNDKKDKAVTKKYDSRDFYDKEHVSFKTTNFTMQNRNKAGTKQRVKNSIKLTKKQKLIALAIFVILSVLIFLKFDWIVALFFIAGVGVIALFTTLLHKTENSKQKRRLLNFFIILCLLIGILVVIGIAVFMIYITIKAPKFDTQKLNKKEMSILYDIEGKEIIRLGSEKREKVTYEELPEVLVDAIVSTEDSRFFQHNGVDAPRFVKASLGQLVGNSEAGGASTLSMQVIKNSFTSTESRGLKGIMRKFTDIYLAVFKLEKNYTKQQIIEFYVNNHFLGGNIYGVEEASHAYFDKSVTELNLSEAATIAGLFRSPNEYRPTTNTEAAEKRRETVLKRMLAHGYITKEEFEVANSIPLSSMINTTIEEESEEYQGYIDTVIEEVKEKYKVNPYTTPLLIYTNMDRSKQDAVNSVFNGESYAWINEKIQAGAAVLDTETGKILAIGAGRNRSGKSTYNYATQMSRQPGSTAKPLFDYGPGMEFNDWSTYGYNDNGNYKMFADTPYTYSNGRAIHNWDGGYYGTISLRRALSASRNIPALKAFQKVDNKKIIQFVTDLGIKPEIDANGVIHEAHSIGAFSGVTPLEMAGAYAAFSNGGYYNEPYSVSKMVYRDSGEVIEHVEKKKKVMSDATAYMITSVLQDVTLTGGTPNNIACKTGTTNFDAATIAAKGLPGDAIRDSWVIGYSTKTVIGMWYGYDIPNSTYVSRNLAASAQKDRLFSALVNTGAMEKNRSAFKQPNSVSKVPIIAGSNPAKLAAEGYSGSVTYEYFKKGKEPTKSAASISTKLAVPGNFKATFNGSNAVHLAWSGVNRIEDDEDYGELVYNVYAGDVLIASTSATSYDYSTTSPYTTYRVIAAYKSYNGANSDPASYELKEELELSITCNAINSTDGASATINPSDCQVRNKGATVGANIKTIKFENGSPTITGLNPNETTSHNVTADVEYQSKTYTLSTTVTVIT